MYTTVTTGIIVLSGQYLAHQTPDDDDTGLLPCCCGIVVTVVAAATFMGSQSSPDETLSETRNRIGIAASSVSSKDQSERNERVATLQRSGTEMASMLTLTGISISTVRRRR